MSGLHVFTKRFRVTKRTGWINHLALVAFLLSSATAVSQLNFSQTDGGIEERPVSNSIAGSPVLIAQGAIPFTGSNDAAILTFVTGNETDKKIKNIITLRLYEESTEFIPTDFTVTIPIKIEYGHNGGTNTSVTRDFTVSYSRAAGAKHKARDYFSFAGAEYVKITVLPFTAPALGGLDIKRLLVIDNEMVVTRYYTLQPGNAPPAPVVTLVTAGLPQGGTPDEALVSWSSSLPPGTGHTHTQLEWAWVEDELEEEYKVNGVMDEDKLFRSNSTRIERIRNLTTYNIPLLYGGQGKLYCRVRAVNIKGDARTDGPWSPAQPLGFGGHNNALNWQATASYAEEGKRKVVVQYFDGSLRNRQTVTKEEINGTTQTVAAETVYDGQGRAAVQVLPAPSKAGIIAYTGALNLFKANTQLNTPDQGMGDDPADFFDLQPVNTSTKLTPALSASAGASQYYSPSNNDIVTRADKNVPDAEGYPYTVTRYMPDATGRIMAQSGVGKTLGMGSGHETKYYYGTASQEELDGLFGTEAGYASHYFKNMVQDANGQMSVSYVDMHGRTVATALAGKAPGLNDIDPTQANGYEGQQPQDVRFNLLNNATNIRNNNSLESVNTLLVPVAQTYHFRYNLTPKALGMPAGGQAQACYDCLYNLEIAIADESGEQAPFVQTFTNVPLTPDDDCGTSPANLAGFSSSPPGNYIVIDRTLLPGSYSVRKTLTVSDASLETYKAMYYERFKGQSVAELAQTIEATLTAGSHCNDNTEPTCASCRADIGEPLDFRRKYRTALGLDPDVAAAPETEAAITKAYNDALKDCDRFCNEASPLLDAKRSLMLSDVIPYTGQYAQETGSGDLFDRFNIFSSGNPPRTPFFRAPVDADKNPDHYRTSTGEIDAAVDNQTATIDKADFARNFNDSWAESLLPYHPEYARLRFAENNLKPSYNWIAKFSAVPTYDAAAGQTPNSFILASDATLSDPFYALPGAPRSTMVGYLTNVYKQNLSLWQIAYGNVMCKDKLTPLDRKTCYEAAPKVPPFNVTPALTAPQKDGVWQQFKNLYAAERDNEVNAYIAANASSPYAQNLVDDHFVLRFPDNNAQLAAQFGPDWNWYPSNGNTDNGPTASAQAANTPASVYTSRCGSYIETWRQSLLQCPALAQRTDKDQILAEITDALVTVCQKGSDAANPYGSSEVAPSLASATTGYKNFEEVIYANLLKYHIDYSDLCSPFVIEFPKPYGKGPLFTKDQIAVVDGCNCDRFAKLKEDAERAGKSPYVLSSFNQYLQAAYGETLTQSLFDQMNAHCGKTESICRDTVQRSQIACNTPVDCGCTPVTVNGEVCYEDCPTRVCREVQISFVLQAPEPLPEFLKCGDGPLRRCLTCAGLSALVAEFKALGISPYNAGPVLGSTDLTEEELRTNVFFGRFANYRTGFQYPWIRYLEAASGNGCNLAAYQTNGSQTGTVLCGDPRLLTDPTGIVTVEDKCSHWHSLALSLAEELIKKRQEQLLADFEAAYREKCLSANGEEFFVDYQNKEFHYTLYYYDMAGNLVKTVPPKGVRPDFSGPAFAEVESARTAEPEVAKPRPHLLATDYRYNSLNQVTAQHSPDGGTSQFWYDKLGRLAVSQNAKQAAAGKYSYTLYDELGRLKEVGQKPQTQLMDQGVSQDAAVLDNWINTAGGTKEQITSTFYDRPYGYDESTHPDGVLSPQYLTQSNLRNRVSYKATRTLASETLPFSATYYTYDVHGNVDKLLQDYHGLPQMEADGNGNRFKLIAYGYDLISGKVNEVAYQPDNGKEAFYHRYGYDAENRLTRVETSRDKVYWEVDATYNYYKHGPLARTVIGQQQVQGVDYVYTLQGWLKGVNPGSTVYSGGSGESCGAGTAPDDVVVTDRSANGTPAKYTARNSITFDVTFTSNTPDEFETELNSTLVACVPSSGSGPAAAGTAFDEGLPVARDAFGFSLHYFGEDYKPVGTAAPDFVNVLQPLGSNAAPLFNGNIASMAVNISRINNPLVYNYHYDQLNRLVAMDAYPGLSSTGFAPPSTAPEAYKERISYDPNGNITHYSRHGDAARPAMDEMAYSYTATTNQLDKVVDDAPDAAATAYDKYRDIKKFRADGVTPAQADGNYTYNEIGNLTGDASEGVSGIEWSVYGKILSLQKNGSTIAYGYDAAGNRISKTAGGATTVYVRDAQGNVLSVYEKKATDNAIAQTEVHLYGSSRLGTVKVQPAEPVTTPLEGGFEAAVAGGLTRGEKSYELTNHLGNVLMTITDRRIAVASQANSSLIGYGEADVVGAQDYYPGGMQMPGRTFSNGSSYKYGFGGKEKDDELKGEGNSYDFGARIYDPRVSRWLSTDPVNKAWLSPYQYASDNPVNLTDPDGGDEIHFHYLTIHKNIPVRGTDGKFHETTIAKTYTYYQVIKDNNQDHFFVHRSNDGGKPTTIEFYPNAAEKTKSGVTTSSFLFWDIQDNDRESLHKIVDEFPGLRNEVLAPEVSMPNDRSQHTHNRQAWQIFYNEHAYLKEKEEDLETSKKFVVGVLTAVGGELLMARLAGGGMWLGDAMGVGADDATIANLNRLSSKKGWFDVVIHGDKNAPGILFGVGDESFGADKLYELMLKNGYTQGTRVRLISCNAANGGASSVAQELSNLTNSQVIAPAARTRVSSVGSLVTEDASKYKVFNPK